MELLPEYRQDPGALGLLYVRSDTGQQVPLAALGTLKPGLGPLSVNHLGQITAVTISFNLKPGVPLGDAVSAIEKMSRELPASITTGFQGTAQVYKASTKGLALLLIMAILVIYIVLGILYESYIHPLTILSGLPSAGFGALVTLLIFGKDLNLYSFVGIIMLIGIVKKNAIMMIDFALEAERNEGKSAMDAIYAGCHRPFPSHHDDHYGSSHGDPPYRPRHRRRSGFAPATRSGSRRRSVGLAAVDPLHHSGRLLLYGFSPG